VRTAQVHNAVGMRLCGWGEVSDARITEIAEAAAEPAVAKTLLLIGIDVSKPLDAQMTFGVLREVARMAQDPDFRKDIEHTRTWRPFRESVWNKGLLTRSLSSARAWPRR